jgi:hypothetical protein
MLAGDLDNFIKINELLLNENEYLREHINIKNMFNKIIFIILFLVNFYRDMIKLVETIGLNESQN